MPPRNFDNTRERSAGVATPAGFNLESEHEAPLSEENAPVQVTFMNGYVAEIPDPDQPNDNGGIAQVFFVNVRNEQGADLGLHVLKRAPHGVPLGTHLLREIALARWAYERCMKLYGQPLVAPGITYGQDGQYQYGLLRFVPGLTLDRHIERRTRLPTFRIVRDLLRATVAMEGIDSPGSTFGAAINRLGGLGHQDMKPENVIFGPDGTVIIDFNTAQGLCESDRHPEFTRGTPPYMAPEQWQGDKQDRRSAQNQIARTALEVLTNGAFSRKLGGKTRVVLRQTLLGEDIPRIKTLMKRTGVQPAAQRLLLRALEPSPADRYPSSQAMLEAVESYLGAGEQASPVRPTLQRLGLIVLGRGRTA